MTTVFEGLDFLNDFAGPDDSEMWPEKYRRLQWNNQEKAWEAPSKFWAGTILEASAKKITNIDHGDREEPGTLHSTLTFAFLAQREMWEREGFDGRIEYSAHYEPGFKSRVHFLVLVKESEEIAPVVVTVGGYTAGSMQAQYSQYRNAIRNTTATLQGRPAPGYLFWCEMTAGGKQMVGNDKKSAIYPPTAVMPDLHDSPAEALQSLYIGDTLATLISNALFSEGQQWAQDHPQLLTDGRANSNSTLVEVFPGGVLEFKEDVTDRGKMIQAALDLELFTGETEASNAFSRFLRAPGILLARASAAEQWVGWQAHLTELYIEQLEAAEIVERQQMLA